MTGFESQFSFSLAIQPVSYLTPLFLIFSFSVPHLKIIAPTSQRCCGDKKIKKYMLNDLNRAKNIEIILLWY